jgi:hypothetical protein
MLLYGRWFHHALCGVFGGKEMIGVLKTDQTVVELNDFFFTTLLHWTAVLDLNISSFHVFVDLLSYLRCFSCILSV